MTVALFADLKQDATFLYETPMETQRSFRTRLLACTMLFGAASFYGGGSALMAQSSTKSVRKQAPVPAQTAELSSNRTPIACRVIRLLPMSAELDGTVVTAIATDRQGDWVAVAGDDRVIRILRVETMTLHSRLEGHRDLIRTIEFCPDGKKLVSAGNDGQLIIWDAENSFQILQRMTGTPAIACARFSPDGSEIAAAGFNNRVFIIGPQGQSRPTLRCDCSDLRCLAYRDDNQLIVVAGRSGVLHLFDPATGNLLDEQSLHRGRIHCVRFHRQSNTLVSVGEDGEAVMFDTENRVVLGRVKVCSGKLFAIAVLDSQHVAVAGADNMIRIINTDDAMVIQKLPGHVGSIASLCASGGWLFSGGFDTTFRRWSLGRELFEQQRIAESELRLDR